MRPLALLTTLLLLALGVAACGEDEPAESPAAGAEATPAATDPAALAEEISTDVEAKPTVPAPQGSPPAELVTEDVVAGEGPRARPGATVAVQYVGVSWSTGQEFDASWASGQPFPFPLGGGQVIPGWDEGVAGMREGGRRLLVIPPELAYGPQGSPPVIAPNETLVFVVDLVDARARG